MSESGRLIFTRAGALVLLGCWLPATSTVAQAQAGPGESVPAVFLRLASGSIDGDSVAQVRYDDLDLSTGEGVMALRTRIKLAANDLCDAQGTSVLSQSRVARACRDKAFAGGMSQLHSLIRETRLATG